MSTFSQRLQPLQNDQTFTTLGIILIEHGADPTVRLLDRILAEVPAEQLQGVCELWLSGSADGDLVLFNFAGEPRDPINCFYVDSRQVVKLTNREQIEACYIGPTASGFYVVQLFTGSQGTTL